MDLHKQIAEDVRSKADRDEALKFLRASYSAAVRGTEWEELHGELSEKRGEINPDDPLELYEVEGRPVGVVWPDEGMGSAWVWHTGSWHAAPGLVNKSWLEGQRRSTTAFLEEFPDADISSLELLARIALGTAPAGDLVSTSAAATDHFEEDPFDHFQRELLKAVGAWTDRRSLDIAESVRDVLREMPASGIFDRDDHKTVWDEYSLQVQSGPSALEWAWDATIDPLVNWHVKQLPPTDTTIMTLWKRWSDDDLADPVNHDTVDPEAVRRLVRQALAALGDEVEQHWVTG